MGMFLRRPSGLTLPHYRSSLISPIPSKARSRAIAGRSRTSPTVRLPIKQDQEQVQDCPVWSLHGPQSSPGAGMSTPFLDQSRLLLQCVSGSNRVHAHEAVQHALRHWLERASGLVLSPVSRRSSSGRTFGLPQANGGLTRRRRPLTRSAPPLYERSFSPRAARALQSIPNETGLFFHAPRLGPKSAGHVTRRARRRAPPAVLVSVALQYSQHGKERNSQQ